jgi:predicted RNA-binding Zn-ribbon protein involved in translation (DUF1610 family)
VYSITVYICYHVRKNNKKEINLAGIKITRIDNFVCPACGEIIRQVAAVDGVVQGYCPHTKQQIRVVIEENVQEEEKIHNNAEPQKEKTFLETLKIKREKVLQEVVSAREDGDLKENAAYHAAREELSKLDGKIQEEENRLRSESQEQ